MKKTKLTIEVDRETQQKLHDACPELISAPALERYSRDWYCPTDSRCKTVARGCGQLIFTGVLHYAIRDIRHLITHLQCVMADYEEHR